MSATAKDFTMLSPSVSMVVLVVVTGVAALIALGWAVARGWVSDAAIRAQASCIFEPSELTDERPWETSAQKDERAALYGAPTASPHGAYGGSR